jgi:hypothetical protein
LPFGARRVNGVFGIYVARSRASKWSRTRGQSALIAIELKQFREEIAGMKT